MPRLRIFETVQDPFRVGAETLIAFTGRFAAMRWTKIWCTELLESQCSFLFNEVLRPFLTTMPGP
jgi:hypothetical protein